MRTHYDRDGNVTGYSQNTTAGSFWAWVWQPWAFGAGVALAIFFLVLPLAWLHEPGGRPKPAFWLVELAWLAVLTGTVFGIRRLAKQGRLGEERAIREHEARTHGPSADFAQRSKNVSP